MLQNFDNIELKILKKQNILEIFNLQEQVFAEGYTEEKLRHNTIKIFEEVFKNPNISLGLFHNKELVAFGISQINPKENKLLSSDEIYGMLPLLNQNQNKKFNKINKLAIIKLIIVKKEYRGNGFQIFLLNQLENMLIKKNIRFLISSVSPKNNYSLDNFLKLGYKIVKKKYLYNNNERYILFKNI